MQKPDDASAASEARAPELPRAGETSIAVPAPGVGTTLPGLPRSENTLGVQVRDYLASNPQIFRLKQMPALRVDYAKLTPAQGGDLAYVRLAQTAGGLDVHGAEVLLTIKFLPGGGRLLDIQGRLYPDVTAPPPSAMSASAAQVQAQYRASSLGAGKLEARGAKIRWIKGRWRTVVEFSDPVQGLRFAVDGGGETAVWSERYYARDYYGNVKGRAVLFDPQATGPNLSTLPLPFLSFSVPGAPPAFTDAQGNFSLLNAPVSTASINVGLRGAWSSVTNRSPGGNLSVSVPPDAPNPIEAFFNPAGHEEFATAQVNAYAHVTRIHEYVVAKGLGAPAINISIPTNVNIDRTCNAFYSATGGSLNFYKAGGGCINSAFDTIVYHEYGHFVDDMFGGIMDLGLSEGWGDVLAVYASGQSLIGENFRPTGPIRNADNNYVYNPADEQHKRGQAWAGFAWDLRKSLGAAEAENLVLPVILANSHDIHSAVKQAALRDDNDGDLSNGTPRFSAILAAAQRHGIASQLDVAGPGLAVLSPGEGAALSGVVTVAGTAADLIGLARIDVSVDNGPFYKASGLVDWMFPLNTADHPNGPHTLTVRATDTGNRVTTVSRAVHLNNPPVAALAAYHGGFQAPACVSVGESCYSGALLAGRGNIINGAEGRAPNNLQSLCADGNQGIFQESPSIESLKIFTSDGGPFAPGQEVTVEAKVWASSDFSADSLELFHAPDAANPVWNAFLVAPSSKAGVQVLTGKFTLKYWPFSKMQAVRANFHHQGDPGVCTPGGLNDHDDLVFAVAENRPAVKMAATPRNVVAPPGGLGVSTITWSAFYIPGGRSQVRVSVDGRPWTSSGLFACVAGQTGHKAAPWIAPGHTYEFRVYPDVPPYCSGALPNTKHVGSVAVKGLPPPSAALTAAPAPVLVPSGRLGSSVITWDSRDMPGGRGQIRVVMDNQPWSASGKFACVGAEVASKPAPWIAPGHTYEFRLYPDMPPYCQDAPPKTTPAAGVMVTGQDPRVPLAVSIVEDAAIPPSVFSDGPLLFPYDESAVVRLGTSVETMPPALSILYPPPGASLSGLVTLSGMAQDDAGVSSVEVLVDHMTQGLASGATFWSFPLDTARLAEGPRTLTIQATDIHMNRSFLDLGVLVVRPGLWAKAPQRFLTPGLQDAVNDAAVFGPEAQEVSVLDFRGNLVYQARRGSGADPLIWNCRDAQDRPVGSGLYIARLRKTNGETVYQNLVVVR